LSAVPGDRIGFLQVADAPLLDMNLLEWSRHHRCFPGQGTLDVTGVVAATLTAGYRGPLSLEVFSDVVRETDPHVTARDAMRSLVFLEDQVASVVPDLEPGVVNRTAPTAARIDGAFLEIACPPGNVHVADVLGALGFTAAGQHRSKPVTWWRNGEAHVVVNTGPVCTPHASAIGVSARPVESVAARASALLWPEVDTTRGAGEAMLPGITSPSGLHVFVSDTPGHRDHWQGDFAQTGAAAPGVSSGLDHIVISVSALQLNEELAFFRTVFGLESGSAEEFMEPLGRLRSIALRPPEGDLRIVLNVTEAPPGARHPHGVTQVALRSDDVASAVSLLRSQGVRLMPVPDNYYSDIDARFGLPRDALEHLREHQLLYDRQGEGELVHAFTEELGAGFHVELLERRHGYAGYGSANTFVRLARQLGSPEWSRPGLHGCDAAAKGA
jgi:4-hydroxyphenylpyruvate dioxygenase